MKSQKKTDDGEFSKALLSTLLEEEEETKTGSPKLARTVQASKFGDLEFEIESNNSSIVLYLIAKNRKKIKLVSAQQIARFMDFLLEQSRYIENLQTKVEKRIKQKKNVVHGDGLPGKKPKVYCISFLQIIFYFNHPQKPISLLHRPQNKSSVVSLDGT